MHITKKQLSFEVSPDVLHAPNFWESVNADRWSGVPVWEPETFEVLQHFISKDHTYLDIGAWIGPTVLFGSQLAKTCHAFEPDPIAFSALKNNLLLNRHINNVHTHQVAVGSKTGVMSLGTNIGQGDSMSSVLWSKESWNVESVSVQDIFTKYNITDCNFIKMDIEGGEFTTLPPAKEILKELQPTLYLSLHAPWFHNKEEFFAKISDTLSIYKSIYNTNGQKIPLSHIPELPGFSAIIATNK